MDSTSTLLSRCSQAAGTVAIVVAVNGCVTETRYEDQLAGPPEGGVSDGGNRILEFPLEDLDTALLNLGNFHAVNLILEVDPAVDLPQGEPPRIVPQLEGLTEIYRVKDQHDVRYASGYFVVGESRYRPQKDARISRLYVFKERRGEFRFRYRTQPIIVEKRESWVPSLYYSVVSGAGTGRGGHGAFRSETLEIGAVTLQADSRKTGWLLNGKPFRASPDQPLRVHPGTFVAE